MNVDGKLNCNLQIIETNVQTIINCTLKKWLTQTDYIEVLKTIIFRKIIHQLRSWVCFPFSTDSACLKIFTLLKKTETEQTLQ